MRDRRTIALLLVVPSLLLVLTHQMFDSQPEFDRVALSLAWAAAATAKATP